MQKAVRGLLNNNNRIDICRICGQRKKLSNEHIIPRSAGGKDKAEFYSILDIVKDPNTKQRLIKQNGICDYTICKECNEKIGHLYDVPFSNFIKSFNIAASNKVASGKITDSSIIKNINNNLISFKLKEIMPFNIAKRILASFCSVERYPLTEVQPDIKEAILNKEYVPDLNKFSIFLCAHIGSCSIFSDAYFIMDDLKVLNYSGIEYGYIGFYFTKNNCQLEKCLNITDWLKLYHFNQEVNIDLSIPVNASLGIRLDTLKR